MWQIGKDNRVTPSVVENRQLRAPRQLTDRTLFIECPHFPVCDAKTAKLIAAMRLSDAAIGGCGKIVVRGKVWHYDFNTRDLNNAIKRRWGRRSGIVQNPLETVLSGSYYDTSRQLWAVPQGYGAKETIKFPAS
jgi:hypothetical protein